MEFKDVIKNRTSVRSYDTEKKVEDEKLQYILECAQAAPSWANKQCCRFLIIKNPDSIKALSKTSIINRWLKTAPILVVACADPGDSGSHNEIEYYTVDVAIALEHLILAATDVGLGSCWIAGFDEEKVKEIVGLPKRMRVVAITPLGYPPLKEGIQAKITGTIIRGTKRKSLTEIVRYEKW